MMKIVMTAGGGGHFAPALSVLQHLPKETDVLFIGRKYSYEKDKTVSFEYKTSQELGITFHSLTTGRLQRRFTRHTLRSLLRIPQGLVEAVGVLKQFRPDVVVSFGGYVSLPVTVAASILKIPVVIHEQTMQAGLANKIAGKFAHTICLSWESSREYFPKETTVLTGNPLRKEILSADEKNTILPELEKAVRPLIYVTGGSLGSHNINVLLEKAIPSLTKQFVIFHQTGDAQEFGDFERLQRMRESLPEKDSYNLRKFLTPEEVAAVFHKASLVIGRSGANTILEILYFGKPAILIPLLSGQKNEQMTNAAFVKKQGLAEIVNETTVTPEELIRLIEQIFAKIDVYADSAQKAKKFIRKDSAQCIIDEIGKAISKKRPD